MGDPDALLELATPPPEPAGARILVIDDEEVVHAALRRMLGRRGFEVTSALSARAALERLDAERFDLLITDLLMPEIDGLELLKQLKQRRIDTPVLMVTGHPTISTALKALRLGAADYLTKPFTRHELLGPVNRSLRARRDARLVGGPRRGSRSITEEVRRATEPARRGDGIAAPAATLLPGARVRLPRHAWAVYCEDGTVRVGIEERFLRNIGRPVALEMPNAGRRVEQGFVGLRVASASGEMHGVFMPLSGTVLEVNRAAQDAPARLDAHTWVVRIVPTHLERELNVLLRDDEPDAD